jgi:HD-GYP domain-containing protein (c-di-GMP phosphodiesterase class II)
MNARGQVLLFRATVALGLGLFAFAAVTAMGVALGALALAAAAAVAGELIQVSGDETSLDPVATQPFSFSSPAHLAVVVTVGVWPAVFVAALGVLVVDVLRGSPRRAVAFNAAVFAVATAAGGAVYGALGGRPGEISLPGGFLAYAGLAATYILLNLTLVNAMTAFSRGGSALSELRDVLRTDPWSRLAEVALGLVLGLLVLREPWALFAGAPLVLAVYFAYERLAVLRRETDRALETFANVVDERDASTYRHSARVADSVEGFARALGLPSSEVARFRWVGRLHDLGKIGVDSSLLHKPAKLSHSEQEAMRRHPRLSARIVRAFRLATREAIAIEYHHERFDGRGYFGVAGARVPLAAHVLIVADSYDAMITDRPYRPALSRAEALQELLRGAGHQFHPTIATAFVAFQRGLDPRAALTPADRRGLLNRGRPSFGRSVFQGADLTPPACVGLAAFGGALLGLGAGWPLLTLAGGVLAACALAYRVAVERRGRRLAHTLRASTTRGVAGLDIAVAVVGAEWAGLIAWDLQALSARIVLESSTAGSGKPTQESLSSWLLRDGDTPGVLVASKEELGCAGIVLAVPVADEGRAVTEWLAFRFASRPSRAAEVALVQSCRDVVAHIAPVEQVDPTPLSIAVVS